MAPPKIKTSDMLLASTQKDLEAANEAIEELELENRSLTADIEAAKEQGREALAKLEKQLEFLREELAEAKTFTHLPMTVRMEKVGMRTKIFDALTGLQLHGYSKQKPNLDDGKGASVTITFEADLTNMQFLKPQLDMLDEPTPTDAPTITVTIEGDAATDATNDAEASVEAKDEQTEQHIN